MAASQYRTSPEPITTMPPGIPYIVGNEAAERFSYYGMRSILVIFMTTFLLNGAGELDPMSDTQAKKYYHLFVFLAYLFPLAGAYISDCLWGKYRTIIALSLVYCLGHAALAVDETRLGLGIGLSLIALGAGGIKPCVSAHVGDQFGTQNKHLIERVFGWFYFSINFGALLSTLLIPELLEPRPAVAAWYPAGMRPAQVAFGIPGVFMFLATIVFWLGRRRYAHIPPSGAAFFIELRRPEIRATILRLCGLYAFFTIFWCLYEQTSSAWVLQTKAMDRNLFGWQMKESQVQFVNPLLILLYVPLFNYVLYPAVGKFVKLTPLRKIGCGLFLTAAAFLISYQIEVWIEAGRTPHVGWQLLAFVIITAAETMVSITGLEYSYRQAPNALKSLIMSFYLLSVSLGNLLTYAVNAAIEKEDGSSRLAGTTYYALFTGLMFATAIAYAFVSTRFTEREYVQGDAS